MRWMEKSWFVFDYAQNRTHRHNTHRLSDRMVDIAEEEEEAKKGNF